MLITSVSNEKIKEMVKLHDKKERDKLSSTMLAYIREWHWQNESNLADITWEESVERATESYLKGKFNSSYLSVKECGIDGYANDHPERLAYLEFLKTLPTEDEAELNPNLTSKEIAELYLAGDDIYGIHDSAYFD